ncbi:MAG: ABC transporter permease [Candidatus Sericytochromatia bacterium]
MSVPSEELAAAVVGGDRPGGEEGAPFDETRVPSRWRIVLRRFLRRRLALTGLVTLVALFLVAFAGPHVTGWSYTDKDFAAFLAPPSAEHWFGTTPVGGDVYAITLRGMQKSLVIGLLVAVFSTGMAALVGSFAGYFGGSIDRALMWVVDLLLVLPSFLIVAILSPTFRGRNWLLFVVLLAAFLWMVTARIVRGMTLSLREREYVLAARYMGVPGPRIILRHILPNLSSLLIIDATINVSAAIIAETGLSYFGFGVQPPDVSLGTLIADGSGSAVTYPWLFLFPAGLLILTVLAVNLVGDGLRDALDPASHQLR